jgi:hypothetical protein
MVVWSPDNATMRKGVNRMLRKPAILRALVLLASLAAVLASGDVIGPH